MCSNQLGFSDYQLTSAKKRSKREKFLYEMEVMLWQALSGLIEPHSPASSKKGLPPYPLSPMLRVHLLRQW